MTVEAGFEPGKSDNSVPKTTDSSGGPAGKVVIGANNFFVSGRLKTVPMTPAAGVMDDTEGAVEIWEDVVGCKAYRIKCSTAITATQELISVSSTVYADTLAADINAAAMKVLTPDGSAITGAYVQGVGEEIGSWITWDGTDKIKTIYTRYAQTSVQDIFLEIIV